MFLRKIWFFTFLITLFISSFSKARDDPIWKKDQKNLTGVAALNQYNYMVLRWVHE